MAKRIGIDLGGTKIEGVVLDGESTVLARERVATPQRDYGATVAAVATLVARLQADVGEHGLPVGVGHPGSLSPQTRRIGGANSTCLNGQLLADDLAAALGREPRLANDANCLALSEAADGAAAGAGSVFGVILGTGVGGGLVIDGRLHGGRNGIAGEWGHNPLPWARSDWAELPGPRCWCGLHGCIETWLSGPALAADHAQRGGDGDARAIAAAAEAADMAAHASLARYEDRLARALAHVVNLFDPEVIVLGGGVSQVARLYRSVPALWDQWTFTDHVETRLLPAAHGDSSGVLGAARLWPLPAARSRATP
jgi:fructokinase